MKYTEQQLKDWARQFVLDRAEDLDFGYVGEMFEEEWDPITPDFDAFQALARQVHDLACAAVVTVRHPDEPTEAQQLAERLRALPTVYMDGVEAVPVHELRRVLDEAAQDGGRTDG